MMIVLRVTDRQTDRVPCVMLSTLCLKKNAATWWLCAKSITHASPQLRRGSCQLVADLLRGNWCNGIWS